MDAARFRQVRALFEEAVESQCADPDPIAEVFAMLRQDLGFESQLKGLQELFVFAIVGGVTGSKQK